MISMTAFNVLSISPRMSVDGIAQAGLGQDLYHKQQQAELDQYGRNRESHMAETDKISWLS